MSQHSQRTQRGPSVASIAAMGVATAVSAAATIYVLSGPPGPRSITAGVLGLVLTLLMLSQAAERHADRVTARERIRRETEAAFRASADRLHEMNRSTGTWQGDNVGEQLTVRYERETRRYLVRGWLGDNWMLTTEYHWPDVSTLIGVLTELERSGELVPVGDEGTQMIRARLGMAAWTVPAAEEPSEAELDAARQRIDAAVADTRTRIGREAAEQRQAREVGETTRRIQVPPAVSPSPAALTAIKVPVFRTEAERAAWAHEHDMPTEIFPVQR